MKFKPLIFLLPFLVVFLLLVIIDEPIDVEPENIQNVAVEEENQEYISLKLVIGKKGNLEDGGSANIYSEPDEESEVIGRLEFNCAVVAEENQMEESWIYVDLKDKGYGYVQKEFAQIQDVTFKSSNSVRQALIRNAYSYLGLKFVRYGKSLEDGIDCSNFVQQIYATKNIVIPNVPLQQRNEGKIITKKEMHPGDIIYYDKANNGTGHVGMYMGEGFIINSSGHSGKEYPEGGVRIVRLLYPDRTSYEVVSYIEK